MKKIALVAAFCAAVVGWSDAAVAQTVSGKEAGSFMVRGRMIGVMPDESAKLALNGTGISGSAKVDNAFVPEVDFSYFITENIALELIAATTRHGVTARNPAGLGDQNLGSVWLLPPTLTLQYHFLPKNWISPYVGAGINYTFFYNEKAGGGVARTVDYENSFGWALQAGVDIQLQDRFYLNIDVKKLFLSTDVTINGPLGRITADVDLDPWIVGVGVGYRF